MWHNPDLNAKNGGKSHPPLASLRKKYRRLTKLSRRSTVQSLRRFLRLPPPPIRRPIFIVGTVRSGSTLLAKCLGMHPQVMYLGRELTTEWCDLAGIQIARSRNHHASCPAYGESDATGERCRTVRVGFAELLARNSVTAARFLDKNPHLWNKLPFLEKIFPDAAIIITSRDIRSTVGSMKLLWRKQNEELGNRYFFPAERQCCWSVLSPMPPGGEDASRVFPGGNGALLAEYWLNVYETIEQRASRFAPVVLVKHSDFVVDPQESLANLCDALGLAYARRSLPEAIDPSRNNRWREILTSREQNDLEAFLTIHSSRIQQLRYADTAL